MKETGNMLKDEKRNKKGTEQKQKKVFFLADFLCFKVKGEKEKIVENLTVFFSHAMFLKPREQKQKTRESFSHIFQQKQGSYFWIHQKKGQ